LAVRKYIDRKDYDRKRNQTPARKLWKKEWERKRYMTLFGKPYRVRTGRPRSPRRKFSDYLRNAKIRGLSFDLSFNQFMLFWQKPCGYCGSAIGTIGLDRVDNSKGYSIDNVISSCFLCNHMKMKLPSDIFIDHCRKVTSFNI
jgi:hypothetical protein